ncbi:MAG: acetylxylan esterase [Lentisphaerae bacterium]|nr:acetylxylan esterase [Lentisphaerota bacterium]
MVFVMKKLLILFTAAAALIVCAAPKSYFSVKTCKNPLSYKCGEDITFTIQLTDGKNNFSGVPCEWEIFNESSETVKGKAVSDANKPLELKTKLSKPGFAYVWVWAVDEKGKQRKDVLQLCASAGAEVEKITQSVPEPADFDEYWKGQLERLKNTPMQVKLTPVESKFANVECHYFEITAPGKYPATGYISKPKNAKPKSLKAYAFFYGYGFGAIKKQDQVAARGNLVISVSRYGIPQGKEASYYKNAGKTFLKRFGFRNNATPAECDFNYMILRDLRAVEYMKSLPEWNGRNLTVNGGSMGALQAINVAALDKDVTILQARIPWCANLGGVKYGRLKGWRPEHVPALDYFDIVNQGKRVKAYADIFIGLGDRACPASGQFAMYNAMTCKKKLTYQQTGGHRKPSPGSANQVYTPAK